LDADEDAQRAAEVGSVLWLRLAGTLATATAFVLLCWHVGGSTDGDLRQLAGPVLLLRYPAVVDRGVGIVGLVMLLPCMFAFCVRAETGTIALAILGALLWVGVGILIVGAEAW
jgi:hypothetical protein